MRTPRGDRRIRVCRASRDMLRLILSAFLGVLLLQAPLRGEESGTPGAGDRGERRPSLLLVTLDTTRWDHLQPYGAANVETPTLAALARDGAVFEHAFAVAPITLPAHTAIHTGLYPPKTGVR